MALTTEAKRQEVFSLALEDRSQGYQDLVSNANAILTIMKERDMQQAFSGPAIRERLLYAQSDAYIRYDGYDELPLTAVERINDAEWTPKMAAVPVVLSNEEILLNAGGSQLLDVMRVHIDAAEQELIDNFVSDLHSDGSASKQIGGLQKAIPTATDSGTYGGISRADNSIWRTSAYDISASFSSLSITTFTKDTVKKIFDKIVIDRSRNKKGPTFIASAADHYIVFSEALQAIQRVTDESAMGKLGFTALKYYGAGKSMDVLLEGGIGTAMPAGISYFIDASSLKWRYHPERNFSKIGKTQMPINQDAMVAHIGFMGEITLTNPLHMVKLYD